MEGHPLNNMMTLTVGMYLYSVSKNGFNLLLGGRVDKVARKYATLSTGEQVNLEEYVSEGWRVKGTYNSLYTKEEALKRLTYRHLEKATYQLYHADIYTCQQMLSRIADFNLYCGMIEEGHQNDLQKLTERENQWTTNSQTYPLGLYPQVLPCFKRFITQ